MRRNRARSGVLSLGESPIARIKRH